MGLGRDSGPTKGLDGAAEAARSLNSVFPVDIFDESMAKVRVRVRDWRIGLGLGSPERDSGGFLGVVEGAKPRVPSSTGL